MGHFIMDRIDKLEEHFNNELRTLKEEFELLPDLKVGDWVQRTKHLNGAFYYGKIFKIGNIDTKGAKESGDEWIHSLSALRLATKDKIQAHLSKICCERYIGKTVRCLSSPSDIGKIINDEFPTKYENDVGEDQYWMTRNGGIGMCVYEDGVFAEIIEETMKLPKTVGELLQLIAEANLSSYDALTFLEEKGYL